MKRAWSTNRPRGQTPSLFALLIGTLQLCHAGWPEQASDATDLAGALHLLASLPDAEMAPVVHTLVEPANDLERAMVAVTKDDSARPMLWRVGQHAE